jgi:hypothetical protein
LDDRRGSAETLADSSPEYSSDEIGS